MGTVVLGGQLTVYAVSPVCGGLGWSEGHSRSSDRGLARKIP
ncbi:MAG: hypothetical protein ACAF42_00950 [Limnothrix sp. BL-A-16]|nr:hypothetical protein [Limnothrix sp. FACHB-1083]